MANTIGVFKNITSVSNPAVKDAARLARKRQRHERRLFLTEGEDLLDAALKCGIVPRQVFVLEGYEEEVLARLEAAAVKLPRESEVFICAQQVMDKISELGSSTRVASIFAMLDRKFPLPPEEILKPFKPRRIPGEEQPSAPPPRQGPFLYLAAVQDPGNVGTLIRSAAAFDAAAVLLGPGTADPYAAKALRATMGAIFQLPLFLTVNPQSLVSWCESNSIEVVATDSHSGAPPWQADLARRSALVMGSEREGIPHRLAEASSALIRIPQQEQTESLNVAMAGTAILYEALRQRSR